MVNFGKFITLQNSMKTIEIFNKQLFLALHPFLLIAYQEHVSINGGEPKTEAYYVGHHDVAKVVDAQN